MPGLGTGSGLGRDGWTRAGGVRQSMREAIAQSIENLRANKLRSFLTMFGILWGVIAVVVLTATGEGFQRGNQTVLEELGKNIAIVWGGRTTLQAGGERAGRQIFLTLDDARAIAAESPLAAVVSPEINRSGLQVKSRFNAAALGVHGIEPQYQAIRTIDVERGRVFGWPDEEQVRRVAIIGADAWAQLFGSREGLGETVHINGFPYTVVGKIRKKEQDSNYSGPDNDKVFVPFAAMARDFPRTGAPPGALSQIIVAPRPNVVAGLEGVLTARTGRIADIDWPLEKRRPPRARRPARLRSRGSRRAERVGHLARDADVRPDDRHDARLLLGGRHHHAGPRRHRRDEHHAGGGARADPRDRRPQGARRHDAGGAAAVLPRRLLPHDAERLGSASRSPPGCARRSTSCRCRRASRAWS